MLICDSTFLSKNSVSRRRTDNTSNGKKKEQKDKNDLQNTTQKTKDMDVNEQYQIS
jgi:hypothetical protein